jgi:hypothetical protein
VDYPIASSAFNEGYHALTLSVAEFSIKKQALQEYL